MLKINIKLELLLLISIFFFHEDPRVAGTFKTCVVKLRKEYIEYPVVVIGTTHSPSNLASDIHEAFLHKVNIEVSCSLITNTF